MFEKTDAPILIVMGQSNAHGHGTRLDPQEEINTPLTYVWGLSREENQSYSLEDVVWSPFVTKGMNLGETQDHTCCLAGEFARIWEANAEEMGLPMLYVIQISIGGQGVHEKENGGWNMWYPDREKVIVPGSLGTVDISLYPLACLVLKLAVENLKNSDKTPRILGLHWNQWETEVDTGGDAVTCAEENYKRLFEGFLHAIDIPCPIFLYRPLSMVYQNEEGRKKLTELFYCMLKAHSDYRMLDLTESPLWREDTEDHGIFQEDLVHYNSQVHKWFAQWQWERLVQ